MGNEKDNKKEGDPSVVAKPASLDPLAEKILTALSGAPAASEIVLGGYLALQHYTDYRRTHDIDAWWRTRASAPAEAAIRAVMQRVGAAEGYALSERRFGETVSFELLRERKKHFSFQIAARSVELEPPRPSAWPPILIETLHDNVGSKMNALVDRGAPRDFTDILHVVTSGLTTVEKCWNLWIAKNPDDSWESAKAKVLYHLTALEMRRPLDKITDPVERSRAADTRAWFRREFLGLQP